MQSSTQQLLNQAGDLLFELITKNEQTDPNESQMIKLKCKRVVEGIYKALENEFH